MRSVNTKHLLVALFIAFFAVSCKKDVLIAPEVEPAAKGKFENGFFIVNEGWFGHGTGEVSFFNYSTGKLTDSVFKRENSDKDLKPESSTLQYGTIFKDNLYLVSKVGGPVVVVDAFTLKEKARIAAKGGNDWRAFLGIDENTGLLSSSSGVYLVNLKNMTAYAKLIGADGQVGDMIKSGNYIFMHSATEGLLIYNASDYTLNRKIKGMTVGFAKTPNGKVWYAGAKYLYQTDPQTLAKDSVSLSFTTYASWGAWHAGSIAASTKDNVVYLLKTGSFGGGSEIYKYDGTVASLNAPFATNPDKQIFYGKGIGFDSKLNQVVIQTVQSGYGANYAINNLYFYDPAGVLKNTVAYDGYHFPSITVFHQ
jgi:hypothetical protein